MIKMLIIDTKNIKKMAQEINGLANVADAIKVYDADYHRTKSLNEPDTAGQLNDKKDYILYLKVVFGGKIPQRLPRPPKFSTVG